MHVRRLQAQLRLTFQSFGRVALRPHVLAVAAALAACAPVEITPPQLDLQSDPGPPVDPLARNPDAPVIVRNGKGEVLAEMHPGKSGDASADPPLSAFDGTLVVETKRNDGSTDRQTVTYPAGQPVKLRRDPATGRYVAEAARPRYAHPQVTGEFSVLNLDRPNTDLFRREQGGVVKGSAIQQDNSSYGTSGKIGIEFPLTLGGLTSKSTQAYLGLRAGYLESTSTSSLGDVLANGDQFGIFTPGNGIVTGQDLRDVNYSSEFRENNFGFDLRKFYRVYGGLYVNSAAGLSYGRQTVEERLSTRTSATNTAIDHLQDTDSRYFGLPLSSAMWVNPFPSYQDFWLTAGGTVEPRHHRGETDWRVSVTNLADRTQTLKDNGWSLGGGVHLGGYFGDPFNLQPKGSPLTIGIKAGLRWSATPQVEYKDLNAGDGGATLEHKSSESLYGSVQVQFKF
jgi:hypothetical protein